MTKVIVTPREGGTTDITVVPGRSKHLPPIMLQYPKGGEFKNSLRDVLEVLNPPVATTPVE